MRTLGQFFLGMQARSRSSEESHREILAHQVALLFRQLPTAIAAAMLVALVVVGVMWGVANSTLLLVWFAAVSIVSLYRILLWLRYGREAPDVTAIAPWLRNFLAGTLLSGITWGAAGVMLVGDGLVHQFFFGMLLVGLSAGAVSTLSSYRHAYALFLVPALMPYTIHMASFMDPARVALASLALLYLALMLGISGRIHSTIQDSLRLRFRNLGLVGNLSATKENLEEANMALQREIAQRRRAQEILMKSEQKLRLHVQQAPLAFIEWDLLFRVVEWNPAAERIFGFSREEARGRHAVNLIAGESSCESVALLWKQLFEEKRGAQVTVENRTRDGRTIICEWFYTPLTDPQGKVSSVITLAQDVTASRQAQERLNYLAYHDELTGLPNRALFSDRLSQAMIEARRQGRCVAVLLLDIDNFKLVNDTMGHDAGNALLRDIGKRLSACVRDGDSVARFGGDEFGMVLADMADPRDAMKVAQKIFDAFAQPFHAGGREFFIASSIGITIYPNDSDELDGLMKNVDSAMYHAKAQGRNNFQFYSADLTARARSRLVMETNLRHALERGEFHLHFQPKFSLATGAISGAETLIRWHSAELGMVSPNQFISVAEESGLILPIGEWVLRSACEQMQRWRAAGLPAIALAVNISSKQFGNGRLVDMVAGVLASSGFDPSRLEIEITESLLMDGSAAVIAELARLKELGLSISVDDFGTGYSSLSYLKRFPVDTIKIDRSFVSGLPDDQDDAAIVRAIIAMSHSLRMRVIAEGVETSAQRHFLCVEGCQEIQGFFCGRPVDPDQFADMLRAQLQAAGGGPARQ